MLLRSTAYNSPIDIFAMGCIMAELFTLRPLFPGSSEADQIYKICSVLGSPSNKTWPTGIKLAAQMNFRFPQFVPTPLSSLIPGCSSEAVKLMQDMMHFDPQKRPTASQCLQYAFFQVNMIQPPPLDASFASSNTMARGQQQVASQDSSFGPSSAVGLTAGFAAGASSTGASVPTQQQQMPSHLQYRPVVQPAGGSVQKSQQQAGQQPGQQAGQQPGQQAANAGTGRVMGNTGGSGASYAAASGIGDEFDFPDGLLEQASAAVGGVDTGKEAKPSDHLQSSSSNKNVGGQPFASNQSYTSGSAATAGFGTSAKGTSNANLTFNNTTAGYGAGGVGVPTSNMGLSGATGFGSSSSGGGFGVSNSGGNSGLSGGFGSSNQAANIPTGMSRYQRQARYGPGMSAAANGSNNYGSGSGFGKGLSYGGSSSLAGTGFGTSSGASGSGYRGVNSGFGMGSGGGSNSSSNHAYNPARGRSGGRRNFAAAGAGTLSGFGSGSNPGTGFKSNGGGTVLSGGTGFNTRNGSDSASGGFGSGSGFGGGFGNGNGKPLGVGGFGRHRF